MKKLYIFILAILFISNGQKAFSQEKFLGELRLFPYGSAPTGWMACEGQILNVNAYSALYSLLGIKYGGVNGQTFALPDLRGLAVIGGVNLGEISGTKSNTLTLNNLPTHSHTVPTFFFPCLSANGTINYPGKYAVNTARGNEFNTTSNANSSAINLNVSIVGGTQPVNNMQPYLVLRWCICVEGTYPSRP